MSAPKEFKGSDVLVGVHHVETQPVEPGDEPEEIATDIGTLRMSIPAWESLQSSAGKVVAYDRGFAGAAQPQEAPVG